MRHNARNVIRAASVALALATTGCVSVVSSMPGATNLTGESWYTEATGFFGLAFSTRVYYCPAPASPAPAQCLEAQMISEDQQHGGGAPAKKRGSKTAPAAPAKGEEEGDEQ